MYDFDKQNVITKDNIQMQINALLYFQIVDPFKAVYEINNLPNAIEKLTQTTLRNIIGELELDQTLTSRDTINTKLRAVLDDATNKWGIKVNRVELQDIIPPESVLSAMEKQMQAERNKRAAILTSEGEKQSQILQSEGDKAAMINRAEAQKQQAILQAEGEAQARIRKAEAEAKAIELMTEAVGKTTNPANYLLAQKYIQMMEELAKGDKTKTVYLPYEATNLMGSIGGIKDLFNMAEQLEVKELEQVVVRFSGDSGDGMQLAGNIFSTVSATAGNGISTFPDYPADIRAPQGSLTGVSGFQVHIGAGKVYTPGDLCDVLVAMNAAALKTQYRYAKPQATIIIDTDSFGPEGPGEGSVQDCRLSGRDGHRPRPRSVLPHDSDGEGLPGRTRAWTTRPC